ncbi:MAG: hypothetical protein IJ151_05125 [Bacteroidales bacterium]|nr:hypothetical protein [Bacteroidales bacterium]
MTTREQEIIDLIKREVKPALGCTEPIAVALAVAKAVEILASNGRLDCQLQPPLERCAARQTKVWKCFRERIRNLGLIGSRGMRETDKLILDITICK